MAGKRDFYEVLGVDRNADDAALKRAYRQLAKKYHPDANPGDEAAAEKFKEASEAYSILSDPVQRQKYDQYGMAAFENGGAGAGGAGFDFGGMDMGDIFGDLFGDFFGGGRKRGQSGPAKGDNIRTQVRVSFKESIFGCDKELELTLKDTCPNCSGSGARPGTQPRQCSKCNGSGQVTYTQQSLFGMVRNVAACPDCHGTGKIIPDKCPKCGGQGLVQSRKRIQVSVPAGIDNGQFIRIRDKGEPGLNGGPRGDLLVEVVVAPDPVFRRQGENIYSTMDISFADAALGACIRIPTVDGDVIQDIKAGTQTDTKIRLRGKGVPQLRNKNVRGDHYVTLVVKVPTRMNEEQREALKTYDELMRGTFTDPKKKKGFFK